MRGLFGREGLGADSLIRGSQDGSGGFVIRLFPLVGKGEPMSL